MTAIEVEMQIENLPEHRLLRAYVGGLGISQKTADDFITLAKNLAIEAFGEGYSEGKADSPCPN